MSYKHYFDYQRYAIVGEPSEVKYILKVGF